METFEVESCVPSFLRYLYKAMIHFSHVYTDSTDTRVGVTYYIMRENLI